MLLGTFASTGRLPETSATASSDGVSVFTPTFQGDSPAAVVRAALGSFRPADYVAFLSYLPATSDVEHALRRNPAGDPRDIRVASTFGVGPRYLHSTGQYHKGGPNTVLAFVVTADDETSTEIPEAGYTFSILKRAQALGDAETLDAHGRRSSASISTGGRRFARCRTSSLRRSVSWNPIRADRVIRGC